MNKVCVVMPMYGHHEMTKQCVDETIEKAGMPVDVLVVDDGSKEPFNYEREGLTVLRLKKNTGYTGATNAGILFCGDRYDYLHLQNNDIHPYQDYIKLLFDVMEEQSVIGIAGSVRILNTDSPHNIELYGVDLIRGYQMMTNGDVPNDVLYVHWVPLCSSLVRAEMLRYIGILDPRMIMWCSDNDLCIRANFAGWNVALVMKSRVHHIHQVSTGTNNEAGVKRDQAVLLEKISGYKYAELMKTIPLDAESQTYGKLEFSVYKK